MAGAASRAVAAVVPASTLRRDIEAIEGFTIVTSLKVSFVSLQLFR
jgi:hypothetical protein